MPATTAKGWPYVLPADNVADYPTTSQSLATKLDSDVPPIAAGQGTTPAGGTLAVTFPAGRFTVTPTVIVSVVSGSMPGSVCQAYVGAPSTTGFTIRAHSTAAPAGGALTVAWIAAQITP